MLTESLISQTLPVLHSGDKVHRALQLMNDNHVTHLAISDDEKYAGIISEDDLLQAENDNATVSSLHQSYGFVVIKNTEHFIKALRLANENGLSIVPVVDEDNYLLGSISYVDLLKQATSFMNMEENGGLIVLEVENNQYSFNEINRLVETNNAQITQLNTRTDPETGLMQVTLRVNKSEISDIIATFQRYDYPIKYYFGEEQYENELKSNYENLMNYLDI